MLNKLLIVIVVLLALLFFPLIPHEKEISQGVTIIEYGTILTYIQQNYMVE